MRAYPSIAALKCVACGHTTRYDLAAAEHKPRPLGRRAEVRCTRCRAVIWQSEPRERSRV